MRETNEAEPRRRGRPSKYDPLELASIYCDGVNRGQTATAIAKEVVELVAARNGMKRTRQTKIEIEQAASNLVKAFQRSRETMLQPWNPEIGKGVHKFEKSTRVISLGEPMFMGRPLPLPLGIEPRLAVRPGRPRKSRS